MVAATGCSTACHRPVHTVRVAVWSCQRQPVAEPGRLTRAFPRPRPAWWRSTAGRGWRESGAPNLPCLKGARAAMAHPLDFSGVIPQEFSAQIIQEAIQQSIVLQLGNILPMGTAITDLPVPKTLPTASFTGAPGSKKPWTDVMLEPKTVHAEEVAAITAIPDAYLEDSTINLWGWVRPRLAEAIAVAIDNAVLFGVGAPLTFPSPGQGGLTNNLYSQLIGPDGLDAVDGVNQAMAFVEGQGIAVTGHAA